MNHQDIVKVVETLEITPSSLEMKVLGTILRITGTLSKLATANEIYEEISKHESVTRNWIYKILASLVHQGFIRQDKIRRPHLFHSSEDQIMKGIENRRREKIKTFEIKIQEIEKELELLQHISGNDIFSYVIGKKIDFETIPDPSVIEGTTQVEMATINRIFRQADKGDVINIISTLSVLPFKFDGAGQFEREIVNAAKRGATVEIILVAAPINTKNIDLFSQFIYSLKDDIINEMKRGTLRFFLYPKHRKTYRFFALNRECMSLYISDLLRPETSIVFSKETMPELLRGAFETYSLLKKESINIQKVLTEALMKIKIST